MQVERRPWLWLALPALATSLGWGLRGFIGGGPLGAMIPGAMIGLAMAALLQREALAAWLAACGAIGIGLGGQMTYGQTVGLSLKPETFWWAMLGFAVKGGAWGLAGGAVFGAGIQRGSALWSGRRFVWGLVGMLAATWAGWRFINAPKLVYFSDPLNKPREEVWAGLLAGALAFLWIAARGPLRRVAWRFALLPCLGGALGFPVGAALQAWGRGLAALHWLDWWKGMEFTFGAWLGAGFGAAAWLCRADLPHSGQEMEPGRTPWLESLLLAAAAVAVLIGIEYRVPLRFNYSAGGALVLAAAMRSSLIARHAAVTVTLAAFVMDLAENKPLLAGAAGWAVVIAAGTAAAAWLSKERRGAAMFLFLMWSAVAVSLVKTFLPPLLASSGHMLTEAVFVTLALACMVWMRGLAVQAAETPVPPPVSS